MSRYVPLFRVCAVIPDNGNAIVREKTMAGTIAARLAELGIELPKLPAPAGAYVPYTISGKTLYISGRIRMRNGALSRPGKVGSDLSVEDGYGCARVCALEHPRPGRGGLRRRCRQGRALPEAGRLRRLRSGLQRSPRR